MYDEELTVGVKVVVEGADTNKKVAKEASNAASQIADGYNEGAKGANKMSTETQALLKSISSLTKIDLFSKLIGNETIAKYKELGNAIKNIQPPIQKLKQDVRDAKKAFRESVKDFSDINKKVQQINKTRFGRTKTPEEQYKYNLNFLNTIRKAAKKTEMPKSGSPRVQNMIDFNQAYKSNNKAEQIKRQSEQVLKDRRDLVKQKQEERKDLLWNGDGKELTGILGITNLSAITALFIVISKTVKKIKQTVQEINNLWKDSLQNHISTQYNQQLQYLQDYLGVSDAQLQTILEEDTATVKKLLNQQAQLGGVATDEQIRAVKQLNQATTNLKEAWSNMWYNMTAKLAPAITEVVNILTAYFAVINDNLDSSSYTDEYVEGLKEGAYYSEKIKKNLMGFDELNVLSSNSALTTSTGESEELSLTSESDMQRISQMINKFKEIKDIWEQITSYLPSSWGDDSKSGIMQFLSANNIKELLDVDWSGTWENLKNWGNVIAKPFKDIAEVWPTWKSTIGGFFTTTIPGWFTGLWKSIKNGWNSVCDWFVGAGNSVKAFFTETIPEWFTTACDSIKTAFTAVGEFFKNIFKGAVNVFIGGINVVIDGLNKIKLKLPEWNVLGDYAGKSWGVNISKVPLLAKGGAVYQPTTAIVGEYAGARSNPEIVAPQSIMYETVRDANGDIINTNIQLARQIIQAISSKDLSVSIGDKDIAEATNRYNNQYRRMTGKALLTI